MVNFKGRHYEFEEIKEKVISGDIDEEKDFIIEALRMCFFTEDGTTLVDEEGITILINQVAPMHAATLAACSSRCSSVTIVSLSVPENFRFGSVAT